MKRILALDILRGITLAGMLLVNNPGDWGHIFTPLEHAEWNGLTPTDLVFPFFMFIMGISTYISLRKYEFVCNRKTVTKIIRRTVVIFLVGMGCAWFSSFFGYWWHPDTSLSIFGQLWDAVWCFPHLRILGVLHRLALCYGAVGLLSITVNHRHFPCIIAVLLIGYGILLLTMNGYIYDGDVNILGIVDQSVLTIPHMYVDHGIDPEGVLSTIPSIAHTMVGFCVGKFILCRKTTDDSQHLNQVMLRLFIVGVSLTFAGLLLQYGLPINKKVWSPTFVLTTCGLASSLLALLIWIIDVKGYKRWTTYFHVFGVNPLFLYVVGWVLAVFMGYISVPVGEGSVSLQGLLCDLTFRPLAGEYMASLLYAITFNLMCWCIGYPLYKNKKYIKI